MSGTQSLASVRRASEPRPLVPLELIAGARRGSMKTKDSAPLAHHDRTLPIASDESEGFALIGLTPLRVVSRLTIPVPAGLTSSIACPARGPWLIFSEDPEKIVNSISMPPFARRTTLN